MDTSFTGKEDTIPESENRLPPDITAGSLILHFPASRTVKSKAAAVYALMEFDLSSPKNLRQSSQVLKGVGTFTKQRLFQVPERCTRVEQ